MLEASDGFLYGTTDFGGEIGFGTVYKTSKNGTAHFVLRSFTPLDDVGPQPWAPLIEGSDGVLYGSGRDALFKINKDGSEFTVLTRATALRAALLEASDGFLYGAPEGLRLTVFRIGKDGSGFTNFVDLPRNRRIDSRPRAPLLLGSDGRFYGTAEDTAERTNAGSLFTIDANGGNYRILHDFKGAPADGSIPNALIEASDGFLYGSTQGGGVSNFGTIFRLRKNGLDYRTLYEFRTSALGRVPRRLIEASDGDLYGVASAGGHAGIGVVFKIQKDGTNYSVVRSMSTADGIQPRGGLVQGTNGLLYGVALVGGAFNGGTIFKVATNGTAFGVIHSFRGGATDGQRPMEGLIMARNGVLYGTTWGGGHFNAGIIYAINQDGTGFRLLHSVHETTGIRPTSLLVETVANRLLGTCSSGGRLGRGSIFAINIDGGSYETLWHFTGTPDGMGPVAGLTAGRDGWVYGCAEAGGELYAGTIYRFDPAMANLRIDRQSTSVVLRWERTASTNDQLEWTQSLSPASWIAVEDPYKTNGAQHELSLPPDGHSRFFRLRRVW